MLHFNLLAPRGWDDFGPASGSRLLRITHPRLDLIVIGNGFRYSVTYARKVGPWLST